MVSTQLGNMSVRKKNQKSENPGDPQKSAHHGPRSKIQLYAKFNAPKIHLDHNFKP